MRSPVGLLVLIAISGSASAHHSRAEFGAAVEEISGELVEVRWINPHAGFVLKTEGPNGQQIWKIETFSGPRAFLRFGVTADLFRKGEQITFAGHRSKYREDYFLGTSALLADGTEVLIGEDGRHWTEGAVVGAGFRATQAVDEQALRAASGENRGIFRVWSVTDRTATESYPFTDAAVEARANWDPAAEPVHRCQQPGMPVTMKPITPIELVDEGERILLRTRYFDTVRTIHLQQSTAVVPASPLGYSIGRWDGRTLVVETTRINYPRFDTSGTPQSDQVRIRETFTVSDDQSRLDYHMTITDPQTFTAPAEFGRYYLALGESLEKFECTAL
ncbi:MAG TPA: DUF6152 family protein [Gammaproteobacteria bacterium]